MILLVILRSRLMKAEGIKTFHFGSMDKKDFLIVPFALFYFYLIIANVFGLPKVIGILSDNAVTAWIGAALCILAPILFIWGLISFGQSFRVGIDTDKPGKLITTGAFAVSRNPLYIAFQMILISVFLIFPTWIFFAYFLLGLWVIDRQVCLEETTLKNIYGKEYDDYCNKVRRYI